MASTVTRNALWNLVSLGSGALVSVGIPPFLTRSLDPATFGAWALVLQVAGYVTLLSFGMQTVVARHVAIADHAADQRMRDEYVSTSFWILGGAAVGAVVMLGLVVSRMDLLAPGWPPELRERAAWAALITGAALAISLPANALSGMFMGIQRNEVPALAIASMRVLICITVIATAHATGDLVWMAWAYFGATLAGTILQGVLWLRHAVNPSLSWARVTARAARVLRDECAGLTVWSVAMLLISGLSLVLVARLDLPHLPYYSVAATLVLFMVGMVQALGSAILPIAAQRVATGDAQGLALLLGRASRYCALASLLMATPLVAGGAAVLGLWVGPDYAQQSAGLLALLTVGHCLRMAALPYVTVAVAAGLQSRMLVLPLLEGVVNLGASLVLGSIFGAAGVAAGTLVGAALGVGGLFLHHPLRQTLEPGALRTYLRVSVLPGLAILGFLAAWGTGLRLAGLTWLNPLAAAALALMLVSALGWSFGLTSSDRQQLMQAVRQRISRR
jgi:O-antigen/teichoic acid export membrane protein